MGAFIIEFPVAATEEICTLSANLSLVRVLEIDASSVLLLGIVIYLIHHHEGRRLTYKVFVMRVVATYAVTFCISAFLLFLIDQLALFQDPLNALKRIILVSFPASFAATAVNSFSNKS